MSAPVSKERLDEIRANRYQVRSLAAADVDITDLLAEVTRLREERHTTNEALSEAAEAIRAKDQRITELEAQAAKVAEFVAARAEYITAIRNCHPDNGHDYHRWQGHAESRRQLAETLGLPVAWPAKDGGL